MTTEVKVPRLAESVSDAVLVEWLKGDGMVVRTDEPIATLETDKAAVEIPATESGVLHHARQAGDRVQVGDVLASIESDGAAAKTSTTPSSPDRQTRETSPQAPPPSAVPSSPSPRAKDAVESPPSEAITLSPAVRRLIEEHGLKPQEIEGSGRGGRLLKEDVLKHLEQAGKGPAPAGEAAHPIEHMAAPSPPEAGSKAEGRAPSPPEARSKAEERAPRVETPTPGADEHIVPMTRIRQRIAERLVKAQHTAAILTTFNEIDMTEVLALRSRYREDFERRHGVKLGFMSFFSRACILALAEFPELNAEIRDGNIVYHRSVHLGIAVQTERGLVVPVVRAADRLGFAELEREIARLAERARDGVLAIHELSGGTFTISNGGVYGSLLSTPILNPPQSGILGMHKIERRPIALDDQVVVRSMMYVALSYDHRIVDGQQAVTFLVRVKASLEDPGRMLLDV